jgi:hypothetical protein
MKKYISVLACAVLALAAGCIGCGGGSKKGSDNRVMSYADPAAGTGFRFVRNTSLSTPTHLVLDLVAAGATAGQGASNGLAFDVSHGAQGMLEWAKVADSDPTYVRNGAIFGPWTGVQGMAATASLERLKVVVGQKGVGSPKDISSGVLASIALDLAPGSATGTAPLSVGKFQMIPASRSITTIDTASVLFGTLTVAEG